MQNSSQCTLFTTLSFWHKTWKDEAVKNTTSNFSLNFSILALHLNINLQRSVKLQSFIQYVAEAGKWKVTGVSPPPYFPLLPLYAQKIWGQKYAWSMQGVKRYKDIFTFAYLDNRSQCTDTLERRGKYLWKPHKLEPENYLLLYNFH